jgi:hypothetical protein
LPWKANTGQLKRDVKTGCIHKRIIISMLYIYIAMKYWMFWWRPRQDSNLRPWD